MFFRYNFFSATGILRRFFKSFSRAIVFTLLNSLWRIVSGPVTLLLIPLYLTAGEQGFWYTFIGLSALTILADLGFTTIVTQFSAHEYANLDFHEKSKILTGNQESLVRIGSLFRFVFKWAITVGVVGCPIIWGLGVYLFTNENTVSTWVLPWSVYVVSSLLGFVTGCVLSFFQGCNQISTIEKNRLVSSIVGTIITATFLYFGFGLYALAFGSTMSVLMNIGLIVYKFGPVIRQLAAVGSTFVGSWRSDFLRLIWRYAISWGSGYFMFQIYTPLMFRYHGAVEAGKVGITVTLVTAAFSIANVWMYVANPQLNMFASKQNWAAMDRLIIKSVSFSLATFIFGAAIILGVMILFPDLEIVSRFLGIEATFHLLLAWCFLIVIYGLAMYLRAHKQEPMAKLSFISAIYIGISSYFIIKYFTADYLFLGFLSAQFWGLPATLYLFFKKRDQWHRSFQ